MQDYIDLAEKNGIILLDTGKCQFCGANTKRGIHECLEIFNLGFQNIDFRNAENHKFIFFIADAHTLQHPEIHGRWSNHLHLSRLHLVFKYNVHWTYKLTPRLSDFLNKYKADKPNEYLILPQKDQRGKITSSDILEKSNDNAECKALIKKWAIEVYNAWHTSHELVDHIAKGFLNLQT